MGLISINAQVCDCSDEDNGLQSEITSSDGFESYTVNNKIPTGSRWSVFPPSGNYTPGAANVVSNNTFCGSKALRFQYSNNNAEDMLYSISGWRTSFHLLVPSGKNARFSYLDGGNKKVFHIYFKENGILETSDNQTGNFTFNKWMRVSILTDGDKWRIFLENEHVFTIENKTGFMALKANFYAHTANDLFYIDKLCHLSPSGFVTCTNEFNPVCLNKSNIQAGSNDCNANSAGYLNKEFHSCSSINACEDATPIVCGQTISSTTIGETYKFYRPDYGNCLPQNGKAPDFRAPDKVFKFTKTNNTGDVGIHLVGKTRNVDLDVFLVDKCGQSWVGGGGGGEGGYIGIVVNVPPGTPNNPNINCIASGTSTVQESEFDDDFINFPNLPSGEYYIIVDGQHWKQPGENDDAGAFDLTLTCFDLNCVNAIPIQCDNTLSNQSNINGANNVSVYCSPMALPSGSKEHLPAGSGCTGNEMVYTFVSIKTGEITISLTGIDANEDFELFVFSNCNHTVCLKSSTKPRGVNELINLNVINGNRYYIVVDGFKGTHGNYNLSITGCETLANPCDNATPILCGQAISSTTIGESYKFYRPDYGGCLPQNGSTDFRAPDKVFKFTKADNTGDVAIHLWGKTRGVDLDVFLLDKCGKSWAGSNGGGSDYQIVLKVPPGAQPATEVRCIASGVSTLESNGFDNDFINVPDLPAGEYYIVVDGQHWKEIGYNDDAGDFDLSLTCLDLNCNNATPILCDNPQNNQTNANGSNNVSVYCSPLKQSSGSPDPIPMGTGCTGNEKVYTYKATKTGEITVSLTGVDLNEDFDLFVFSNCNHTNCLAKSTSRGNGLNESITLQVSNGNTYYIVVDGYKGTQGNYNLLIEGCAPVINRCENIEELSCGTRYQKSTVNSSNKFSKNDYSSCLQTNNPYDGNDIVFKYKITNQFPNPTILLWGYTGDLDLFVLNECGTPAKCIKSSQSDSRTYEFVEMKGLPLGEYYIVVDGKNTNQKSEFKISVACQPGCTDPATIDLNCNTSVVGNTEACEINFNNKYSCDPDYRFSGPECFYRFTAPEAGEYTFDLFGFGNKNLDLFILNYTNCNSTPACIKYSANNIPGQAEQVKITLAKNQLITVVVDGSFGDGGEYALTTLCPGFLNPILTFNVDDSICGQVNDIVKIPIRVKNFKNIRSFQFTALIAEPNKGTIASIEKGAIDGEMNTSVNGTSAGIIWDITQAIDLPDNHIVAYLNVRILNSFNGNSDIILNGQTVDIYAEDVNGKSISPILIKGSYCTSSSFTIGGKITREDGIGVQNVVVTLNGPVYKTATTDINGNYSFTDINSPGNFTIKPVKDNNYKNGVNTGDVGTIRRHILKIELLNSPYKIIAADAKNPVSINTGDVSEIRQLILGNINDFPERESWTFVDKSYIFPDPANPFSSAYPTTIVKNISSNISGLDFIAVKIGDVNNTNDPAQVQSSVLESRTAGADLYLYASDVNIGANQKFSINITAKQFQNIRAGQFSINWDKDIAMFESVTNINSVLGTQNTLFNTAQPGKLGFIWDTESQVSLPDNTILFTINLKSFSKKAMSFLKFSSDPVDIYFEDKDGKNVNVVTQNSSVTVPVKVQTELKWVKLFPNPSKGIVYIKTPIKINTIKVLDLTGRKLIDMKYQGDRLELSDLGAGTYLIHMISDKSSVVQKLVIEK